MATARAAIERANRPGHDDASVRRRAEELSRRFSLGGEPPASEIEAGRPSVMIPPAAVPPVIIPPAVVPPAVVPEASLKPGKTIVKPNPPTRTNSVTVPVTTGAVAPPEVQPLDASVRTQSAMATERLRLAAPPPPRVDLPPLPKRAPKVRSLRAAAEAPGTATKAAITRARPARSYSSSQSPSDPRAALRGTVMTNQLRAFGWNNQPD
jgi:hypothetical protein